MSIFGKWFGRGAGPPEPERDIAALATPLARPAVLLVKSSEATGSYFGGDPALPPAVLWPSQAGKPLAFLACIDLAALREVLEIAWLPASGRLLFFYDVENQPWGSDLKDRGGWAVIHAGAQAAPPSVPPSGPTVPRQDVSFRHFASLPSSERPEARALGLNDVEAEQLNELRYEPFGDAPHHQIDGFPMQIQSDEMEIDCQLATRGRTADFSGDWHAERERLRGPAADWRLLLQMDSDGDLMWGDAGTLYFWVREQDARAGRLDDVWLQLQCY